MQLKLTLSNGESMIKEIDSVDFGDTIEDITEELFGELFNKSDATKEIIADIFEADERNTFDAVLSSGSRDIEEVINDGYAELEFSDEELSGVETDYTAIDDILYKLGDVKDDKIVFALIEYSSTMDNFESELEYVNDMYLVNANTDEDLGFYWVEDVMGGVDQLDSTTLENYFDYDKYGRDIANDFYKTSYGYLSTTY